MGGVEDGSRTELPMTFWGEFTMLRFCSTVWGHARDMRSLIMASVAAGALAAPVVFAVSAPNDVTVTVFDFGFNPTNIRVPVGGSVTWNYTSGASEHEIAADDGTFTGGILMPGQMYTASAFTMARNYPYHCAIHSFMRGTVIAVGLPHTMPIMMEKVTYFGARREELRQYG
jgi:plastocyanin